MGMYDNIWCRRVLPDGLDGNEYNFQTKTLDCFLYQFEIRKDGLLVKYDITEDGDIDHSVPPRLIDYHGIINFYTHLLDKEHTGKNPALVWHEYNAKFTDGKLIEITALPPRPL